MTDILYFMINFKIIPKNFKFEKILYDSNI